MYKLYNFEQFMKVVEEKDHVVVRKLGSDYFHAGEIEDIDKKGEWKFLVARQGNKLWYNEPEYVFEIIQKSVPETQCKCEKLVGAIKDFLK